MIDQRSVEVFWWVVRLGGFRRAAERLNTTQPAISARIAALEAVLGGRLLERGQRRRVAPTPKGLLLMGFAERQLALAAEMQAAFTGPGTLHGTVRLGVSETIVHTWLAALLRRVHERYPALELDIVVDVSTSLRAGLLAGEIDLAFLLGPVAAPGVEDHALCEHALAWVAPPGRFAATAALDLAALARVPIITYPRTTRPYQQVRELFAGHAPAPRIFANASLASIVRMVLDGIGVGVIAAAAIPEELASGRLVMLRTTATLEPLRFTASWRAGPDCGLAAIVARMAVAIAAEFDNGG